MVLKPLSGSHKVSNASKFTRIFQTETKDENQELLSTKSQEDELKNLLANWKLMAMKMDRILFEKIEIVSH